MKLIGLIGGIASGKSEAARHLRKHGFPVIDADQIGHELIAPGGAAESAVREAFGEEIVLCGTIDRARLAARVFNDATERKRLNDIVHPAIFMEIGRRCAEYARQGHPAAIVDAALLCENRVREPWLDRVILILAARDKRMHRMVALRGMTTEDAEHRMNAQTPPESKIPLADWTINNDGSLDEFLQEVDDIIKAIDRDIGRS